MGGFWSESRRAEREAQPRLFGVLAWTYPYSSPPSTSDSSSSEKKQDVSDDKDLVESPDDQMSVRSTESSDSDVSLKSDQSKGDTIDFKDRVSPSTSDSSSSEKKHDVSDDEDLVESPDDLMVKRSMMSIDSGVSVKSDGSKAEPIDFKEGVSPRPDTSSSEEEDVSDDEDLVKSSDVVMATQSQESSDSGVSLKSDRSE